MLILYFKQSKSKRNIQFPDWFWLSCFKCVLTGEDVGRAVLKLGNSRQINI